MSEQLALLISFVIFSLYLLGAFNNGVPKSISESDYLRKKPWKQAFEITMMVSGAALIYTGIKIYNPLLYIAGLSFIIVGLFSDFKRSIVFSVMHYIGAIVGYACMGLCFIIYGWWWYSVVYVIIALLFSYKKIVGKETYHWLCYFEIALAYCAFIGLNIYMILK